MRSLIPVLTVLCLSFTSQAQVIETSEGNIYIPPPMTKVFQQPERVQIFLAVMDPLRIGEEPVPNADTLPRSGDFILIQQGPELTKKEREALALTWVSPESYKPGPKSKCMFHADIALRFWHDKTWVDAIVCLGCQQIVFHNAMGDIIQNGFLTDFNLMRKLAKQAFPEKKFRGDP